MLILVIPLLHLSYVSFLPTTYPRSETETKTHILMNPPTESKDLDDAYNEAKRLFSELYGDEDFLLREETNEMDGDDE